MLFSFVAVGVLFEKSFFLINSFFQIMDSIVRFHTNSRIVGFAAIVGEDSIVGFSPIVGADSIVGVDSHYWGISVRRHSTHCISGLETTF